MLRLILPLILLVSALVWLIYVYAAKKDKKQAKNILSITLFFGLVWGGLYYFLFAS